MGCSIPITLSVLVASKWRVGSLCTATVHLRSLVKPGSKMWRVGSLCTATVYLGSLVKAVSKWRYVFIRILDNHLTLFLALMDPPDSTVVPTRAHFDDAVYVRSNIFSPALARLKPGAKWDLAVFLFSHIGLSVSWCCHPSTWLRVQDQIFGKELVICDNGRFLDESRIISAIVVPLLMESMELNQDLQRGLLLLKGDNTPFQEDYTLVTSAFPDLLKSKQIPTPSNEFANRVFRPVLLDRGIHSFSGNPPLSHRRNLKYLQMVINSKELTTDPKSKVTHLRAQSQRLHEVLDEFIRNVEVGLGSQTSASIQEVPNRSFVPRDLNIKGILTNSDENSNFDELVSGLNFDGLLDESIGNGLETAAMNYHMKGDINEAYANICTCSNGVFQVLSVSTHTPS